MMRLTGSASRGAPAAVMVSRLTSRFETIPVSRSPSSTSRWRISPVRIRPSAIESRQSSCTVVGSRVIQSRTVPYAVLGPLGHRWRSRQAPAHGQDGAWREPDHAVSHAAEKRAVEAAAAVRADHDQIGALVGDEVDDLAIRHPRTQYGSPLEPLGLGLAHPRSRLSCPHFRAAS